MPVLLVIRRPRGSHGCERRGVEDRADNPRQEHDQHDQPHLTAADALNDGIAEACAPRVFTAALADDEDGGDQNHHREPKPASASFGVRILLDINAATTSSASDVAGSSQIDESDRDSHDPDNQHQSLLPHTRWSGPNNATVERGSNRTSWVGVCVVGLAPAGTGVADFRRCDHPRRPRNRCVASCA